MCLPVASHCLFVHVPRLFICVSVYTYLSFPFCLPTFICHFFTACHFVCVRLICNKCPSRCLCAYLPMCLPACLPTCMKGALIFTHLPSSNLPSGYDYPVVKGCQLNNQAAEASGALKATQTKTEIARGTNTDMKTDTYQKPLQQRRRKTRIYTPKDTEAEARGSHGSYL